MLSDLPARDNKCPVCVSERTFVFLNRNDVPVHQNLLIRDQAAAVSAARDDLKFVCCEDCGFVFNSNFNLAKLNYGAEYDNTQTYSQYFAHYVEAMVEYLVTKNNVRNCRIVEVGCGKGDFLRMLVKKDAGNTGHGFDPAYTGAQVDFGGRLRFERRLYGPDCVGIPADVVVCRHVIEHVPEPGKLIRSIRQALSASPRASVFFETPCVEWILRNRAIWDFFYEHPSLFSRSSLSTMFEATGFKVERVQHMFGGQYLWLEAAPSEGVPVTSRPGNVPQMAKQFGEWEIGLRTASQTLVRHLAERGKIAIWGAGAKGVTFANLVDPNRELITCVVDLNPQKQGSYIPGTGHPIVDYRALADLGVTTAILMNSNYRHENRVLLQQAGLNVALVEVQRMAHEYKMSSLTTAVIPPIR